MEVILKSEEKLVARMHKNLKRLRTTRESLRWRDVVTNKSRSRRKVLRMRSW